VNKINAQQNGAGEIYIDDFRIQNAVYRNQRLWCTQIINYSVTNHKRCAIQWWKINPMGNCSVDQCGRIYDQTYATLYAYPSIAVNHFNDVLLGYSSFGSGIFPSANYSYLLNASSSPDFNAATIFNGINSYNRENNGIIPWGHYSTTVVDPFDWSLWTLQEYAEDHDANNISHWGTKWYHWIPPEADLYIKDFNDDDGAEPNPSPNPMYICQDIGVSTSQLSPPYSITNENPKGGGTSFVYVMVRNRGNIANTGSEMLHVYWSKAITDAVWPDNWNGTAFPTIIGLKGNEIGDGLSIPVIQPGKDTILEFEWDDVPDPSDYHSLTPGDEDHFCLLARIVTSTQAPFYGMTFEELNGSFIEDNARSNNNIGWKNISIEDINGPGGGTRCVNISNSSKKRMNVKIKFEALNDKGLPGFLDKGIMKIAANDKLKKILSKSSVKLSDGIKDIGGGIYEIRKDGATLENIVLDPGDIGSLKMEFSPNNKEEKGKGYLINVTQIEDLNGKDHVVGGLAFLFGQVKGFNPSIAEGGCHCHLWCWILILILFLVVAIIIIWIIRKKRKNKKRD
jgi:hypothetical protein